MGTTHFRSKLRYADPQRNARVGSVQSMAGLGPYADFLSDFNVYHNNFSQTSDLDTTNDWTLTVVGTTPTATLSDDLVPSRLILTNSAGATDSAELQFTGAGGTGEQFSIVADKKLYYETRVLFTDANNDVDTVVECDFFAGLGITDTTFQAGATDFIGFSKVDGSGLINFVCGKNTATNGLLVDGTVTSTGRTLVAADANTWIKLGFLVVGGNAAYAFVNGTHVATVTTTTHFPNDENLCVTHCLENGEAVAKILHTDYIFAAQER